MGAGRRLRRTLFREGGAKPPVSVTRPCTVYRARRNSGREVRADVRGPKGICWACRLDLELGHEPPTVAPAPTGCGCCLRMSRFHARYVCARRGRIQTAALVLYRFSLL